MPCVRGGPSLEGAAIKFGWYVEARIFIFSDVDKEITTLEIVSIYKDIYAEQVIDA
jgi:hypothetical protein